MYFMKTNEVVKFEQKTLTLTLPNPNPNPTKQPLPKKPTPNMWVWKARRKDKNFLLQLWFQPLTVKGNTGRLVVGRIFSHVPPPVPFTLVYPWYINIE